MSQFHLKQIFGLVVPCRVPKLSKTGLRCVVCGKFEMFTHEEFTKDQEVRERVMANWVSVFIPGIPPKILCTRCAPSLKAPRTRDEIAKHRQALIRSRENEALRQMCLMN